MTVERQDAVGRVRFVARGQRATKVKITNYRGYNALRNSIGHSC